jgi:hypothetical protein
MWGEMVRKIFKSKKDNNKRAYKIKWRSAPNVLLFFLMALTAHSGLKPLIQFCNHIFRTVWLLGRVISPSQGHYLNTGQHKHRINAYTHQTSMPWVRFKLTIPASERAKTVHVLDRAATVTSHSLFLLWRNQGRWDTWNM